MVTILYKLLEIVAWMGMIMTLPGTIELLLITLGYFLPYKKKTLSGSYNGLFAVIIPAHNESSNIEASLDSLKKCSGKFDLIVIADNCTDDTAEIVEKAKGIRVIKRSETAYIGKHYALQYAFKILIEEKYTDFLVIDADTTVDPWIIQSVQKKIAEGSKAMQVIYTFYNQRKTSKERLLHLASVAFNWVRPLGRQGWGFSVGLYGNGFALSTKILKAVPFQINSIVEDLAYHLKLVEVGFHVDFIEDCQVYTSSPPNAKALSTQRTRWESGRLRVLIDEGPSLFKSVIAGKWRLIEPLLDLLLLPLALHTFIILLLLVLPGFYTFFYALMALSLIFIHVAIALFVGQSNAKDYFALISAPFYIIWKLTFLDSIYKAIKNKMGWVRTER